MDYAYYLLKMWSCQLVSLTRTRNLGVLTVKRLKPLNHITIYSRYELVYWSLKVWNPEPGVLAPSLKPHIQILSLLYIADVTCRLASLTGIRVIGVLWVKRLNHWTIYYCLKQIIVNLLFCLTLTRNNDLNGSKITSINHWTILYNSCNYEFLFAYLGAEPLT